jgi:hypothetical protein
MTDDLVERLREGFATNLEYEAADRIEQLETALREIVAMTPDPEFGTLPIESAIKVARAALGENKDASA